MATGDWKPGDAKPFLTLEEREALRTGDPRFSFPNALGIFGLVVDYDLDRSLHAEIAGTFFDLSAKRARQLSKKAVEVTFHDNDPVQPVALDHGFVFTGRLGESEVSFDLRRILSRKKILDVPRRLYEKPLDA